MMEGIKSEVDGGRHDGGVRSEEGGLGCWLVGVTGLDYCTYYCLSMA
jgi:hypothetical protein